MTERRITVEELRELSDESLHKLGNKAWSDDDFLLIAACQEETIRRQREREQLDYSERVC